MSGKMIRAAACHVSPVFLSSSQTTRKVIRCIEEAARNTANLVVFGETFISAFPLWSALQAPHSNHDFFQRMVEESITIDGPEIKAIRDAARQAGVLVSIGFSERAGPRSSTLYNSNVIIGIFGQILVHHRKLMPTFFERLTWSPGDGHGLRVAPTRFGNVGALICGENTNPLARYALMTEHEQVHISTWPAKWPTRALSTAGSESENPSAQENASRGVNYDNVAANRIRGAAHCFEAKSFGILSASLLDEACVEVIASGCLDPTFIREQLNACPQAPTMFLDPTGTQISGFIVDSDTGQKWTRHMLQDEAGILYADLDLDRCIEGKQYHDVTGGYQRLDVFDLKINRTRREPVTFTDG